jgi:hypothetical protein
MNKGVDRATGDIIGILNADDVYPWTLWLKPLRKVPQWWVRRGRKKEG